MSCSPLFAPYIPQFRHYLSPPPPRGEGRAPDKLLTSGVAEPAVPEDPKVQVAEGGTRVGRVVVCQCCGIGLIRRVVVQVGGGLVSDGPGGGPARGIRVVSHCNGSDFVRAIRFFGVLPKLPCRVVHLVEEAKVLRVAGGGIGAGVSG